MVVPRIILAHQRERGEGGGWERERREGWGEGVVKRGWEKRF